MRKHLALLVEGHGDVLSVPILMKKAISNKNAWDCISIPTEADRVKNYHSLIKFDDKKKMTVWQAHLQRVRKQPNLGGVMLLIDGDVLEKICAVTAARTLVEQAKTFGAGSIFSLAVVIIMQEFEAWLLASIEKFTDLKLNCDPIPANLESIRSPKNWFERNKIGGYKETTDQVKLTEFIDFDLVRSRKLRSFGRFENAVDEMVTAFRDESHVATPRI